ncbi:probable cardiolipin-specific deacylase, mitochondrial [Galdieria sulphuraria]|uniref:Hydrolase, alpha/beta fold family protein n=1 Tax=Galdieria sulphuraria TaxID=130081 RepID=M2XYW9_GALSU|nr:hydrolase, alpha/beta fold family protein [Galdieria sulphuraria]EME28764.1 hydrolase, alpha/beta fold family protein [Galdieria sulphuraria]GJD07112.1 probable cardiolipin-specific deacylase, mitochondrial [Galdieria sulphuraria]|eukprot:XP_005705284.1 hydrolase, alpha/beta fold family protein [Galdieria sulphuraria]
MQRESTNCITSTSPTTNNDTYSTSWLVKLQNWFASWKPRKTSLVQPPIYCQQIAESETKLFEMFVQQRWERRFVELPNGELMNTVILGDHDKPCLVLTPGYCSGIGVFARNLDTLSQHFRVYCVDWLGCGASSKPKFPLKGTVEQAESYFVDSLELWRQQMGDSLSKPFILVGHSLGGYLSAVYASKYPENVERLVLLSPVGIPHAPEQQTSLSSPSQASSAQPMKDDERVQQYRRKYRHWIALFTWFWKHDITPHSVLRVTGPYFGRWLTMKYAHRRFQHCLPEAARVQVAEYVYEMCVRGTPSGEYALNAILLPGAWAKQPLCDRWDKVRVPTIFIYGEQDWMDYRAALALKQQYNSFITDIRRVPFAGHYLFLENPQDFHKQFLEALNSTTLSHEESTT